MENCFQLLAEAVNRATVVAALLEPGPGDALRFVHALCTKVKRESPANTLVLLGPAALSTTGTLLLQGLRGVFRTGRPVTTIAAGGLRLVSMGEGLTLVYLPNFNHVALAAFFWELGTALPSNISLYHCYEPRFINSQSGAFQLDGSVSFPNITWQYLDRQTQALNMSGFLADYIQTPRKTLSSSSTSRALFFIRQSLIVPERNTPWQLVDGIMSFLAQHNFQVDFAGHFPTHFPQKLTRYVSANHLFPTQCFPSYLAQLTLYGAAFDLAIGVNSGGLDLAFAAGVPGVRLGAFHQTIPKYGPDYNKFLTTSTVVNISSPSEIALQAITLDSCLEALTILLEPKPARSFLWL